MRGQTNLEGDNENLAASFHRFAGMVWVIAILSLPLACAPAFLYLVYNFQVEATEGPRPAT